MKTAMIGLSAAVLASLMGACSGESPDSELTADGRNNNVIVPDVTPATTPGPLTAQAWVDDFSLGKDLTPEGIVADEEDAFVTGETIHLSMQVDDAPAGASVTVQWFGPDDVPLGGETKMVSAQQETLAFVQETERWLEGDYRAEVWVGDQKVNEQHFQIVQAGA